MYLEQAAGLFPTPIALGARSVGWIEAEVVTVLAARAAELTNDQVRALVADLRGHRANGSGGVSAESGAALVRELYQWNLQAPTYGQDGERRRKVVKPDLIVKTRAGSSRPHAQGRVSC